MPSIKKTESEKREDNAALLDIDDEPFVIEQEFTLGTVPGVVTREAVEAKLSSVTVSVTPVEAVRPTAPASTELPAVVAAMDKLLALGAEMKSATDRLHESTADVVAATVRREMTYVAAGMNDTVAEQVADLQTRFGGVEMAVSGLTAILTQTLATLSELTAAKAQEAPVAMVAEPVAKEPKAKATRAVKTPVAPAPEPAAPVAAEVPVVSVPASAGEFPAAVQAQIRRYVNMVAAAPVGDVAARIAAGLKGSPFQADAHAVAEWLTGNGLVTPDGMTISAKK